jgi:hypothetical protein
MLRESTDRVRFSLLSLLAILFIAVGMPLAHPALHNHLDHQLMSVAHGVEHFRAVPDEDKAHACPLCTFLATIQLHGSGLSPIIATNELLGKIVSANHIFFAKPRPLQAEIRAPPVSTFS